MSKKIIATGQLQNRVDNFSKGSLYYFHNSIAEWIDESTSGNKQLVVNYILQKGIEALEKEVEMKVVEGEKFKGI